MLLPKTDQVDDCALVRKYKVPQCGTHWIVAWLVAFVLDTPLVRDLIYGPSKWYGDSPEDLDNLERVLAQLATDVSLVTTATTPPNSPEEEDELWQDDDDEVVAMWRRRLNDDE